MESRELNVKKIQKPRKECYNNHCFEISETWDYTISVHPRDKAWNTGKISSIQISKIEAKDT